MTEGLRLSEADFALAKTVCTRKELQALSLWRAHYGKRAIATTTGVAVSTAAGRLARARQKLEQAIMAQEDALAAEREQVAA